MDAGLPVREGIAVPKLVSNSLTTLLKDSCYAYNSVSTFHFSNHGLFKRYLQNGNTWYSMEALEGDELGACVRSCSLCPVSMTSSLVFLRATKQCKQSCVWASPADSLDALLGTRT